MKINLAIVLGMIILLVCIGCAESGSTADEADENSEISVDSNSISVPDEHPDLLGCNDIYQLHDDTLNKLADQDLRLEDTVSAIQEGSDVANAENINANSMEMEQSCELIDVDGKNVWSCKNRMKKCTKYCDTRTSICEEYCSEEIEPKDESCSTSEPSAVPESPPNQRRLRSVASKTFHDDDCEADESRDPSMVSDLGSIPDELRYLFKEPSTGGIRQDIKASIKLLQ